MSETREALAPCHWCNADTGYCNVTTRKWRVECTMCGAAGPICGSYQDARNAWNRRALSARDERAEERERAALIVERWSLPTIQTPSMWLIDKAGIAAAIRAGGTDG